MDDFRALALAWDTLPSETALPVTISPTTAYLTERRSLRAEGDKALIKQLTSLLSTPSDQELPLPTQPANIAEREDFGMQMCIHMQCAVVHPQCLHINVLGLGPGHEVFLVDGFTEYLGPLAQL